MTNDELMGVRRSLKLCRSALADLREGISTIEAELRRLESTVERAAPAGGGLVPRVVAEPPVGARLASPSSGTRPGFIDLIVDRVEELCRGCETLLRRSLRGDERPVVLGWAQLERDGEPVPVGEILALARHLLARPTPDGTLPSTLRWCESTVQTLSRAPLRSVRPNGRAGKAAELSVLYDRLADELDSRQDPEVSLR
jgi:hypothetical protein